MKQNKIDLKEYPTTRYQGSKRRLLPWIYDILKGIQFDSVLDLFGGTASTSYLFKKIGKKVTYNDILNFNYWIGTALIENSYTKLNKNDVDFLLKKHKKVEYPTFIQDTFSDIYYTNKENAFIDRVVNNIKQLDNNFSNKSVIKYKKAIAFYSLFQSCLIKRPFNLFHRKNLNNNSITNPIIFSNDNGENWDLKFDVSSKIFNLTGITRSPDLAYNSNLDVFYYASFDPDAELYNNVMGFIPGDIINAEEMLMYAISACGDDYLETAVTTTENFFLSANIRDGQSQNQYLDIAYFTYPDFESPPVMGGLYPDGESIHKTSPASKIEMDAGKRIYLVAESGVEDGPKITIKSTSANEELLTNGELQNGMDKYADIEQWPGEYISKGNDPDVSAFGNKVYVVYTQNDTVKCSYSTAESGYDPMFNWHVSNVATGAGYPAVYVIRDKVLCAYVKNGDIYEVLSEDGGATWGIASKLNEVDGTVAAEPGSLDISISGVVWTDKRNAAKDIYYAKGLIEDEDNTSPILTIIYPEPGLFLFNQKIMYLSKSIIAIGPVDIIAEASDDESGIDYVEYELVRFPTFIMGVFQGESYIYRFSTISFGRWYVTITAYDNAGNRAVEKIEIWKFL